MRMITIKASVIVSMNECDSRFFLVVDGKEGEKEGSG